MDDINASASPEVQMNDNFFALAPAALFGRKGSTTSGLDFGYYGGIFPGSYAVIADDVVTLTDSATNYMECDSAGTVYVNTSAFTAGRYRLYAITCAGGVQTDLVDYRTPIGVNVPNLAGANLWTGQNTFAAGTLTASKPAGITQTWNAGGVTFTALDVNVTDTASASDSLLIDLRVGGSSVFSVDKAGNASCAGFALDAGAGNFNVIGAATGHTDAQLLLTGEYTPGTGNVDMVGMAIETTLNPLLDGNAYGLTVFPTINPYTSGTHAQVASLVATPFLVGGGAATITDASTLWVNGAPTCGANNYAVLAPSGVSSFGILRETTGEAWSAYTPTISADTGTWGAPTITSARYRTLGKTMILELNISVSVASGAPNDMRVSLPGSATTVGALFAGVRAGNNGSVVYCYAHTLPGGSYISPGLESGTFSGSCWFQGTFIFELE